MKVSRTLAYAIGAMLRLARANQGTPVPCRQLAVDGKMPERFLLQILRSLVSSGILRSTRGVEGGYTLARPPGEITLLDIFLSLDDPLTSTTRPLEMLPEEVRDQLSAALDRAAAAAHRELAEVSLADLLNSKTVESEIA